jgi:hypothetical protein
MEMWMKYESVLKDISGLIALDWSQETCLETLWTKIKFAETESETAMVMMSKHSAHIIGKGKVVPVH